MGRFLTPDPIGFAGGLNRYAYASNDPVGRMDPSGTLNCLAAALSWAVTGAGTGALLGAEVSVPTTGGVGALVLSPVGAALGGLAGGLLGLVTCELANGASDIIPSSGGVGTQPETNPDPGMDPVVPPPDQDNHDNDPVNLWRGVSEAEWAAIQINNYKFVSPEGGQGLYLSDFRGVGENFARQSGGPVLGVTVQRDVWEAFLNSGGINRTPMGVQTLIPDFRLGDFNSLYDQVQLYGYPP